jgi:hypothetical protein
MWTRGLYYMLGFQGGVSGHDQEAQLRRWVLRLVRSLVTEG